MDLTKSGRGKEDVEPASTYSGTQVGPKYSPKRAQAGR